MTEPQEHVELTEPHVTDVPEPDQESSEDEAEEEAEAEQAEPHEPEPEPEAHGPTQEEWEARFTYADRTFSTYAKKVEAKWEEDAVHLVRFNLDPAAPPGYLDMRNKGHVEDDTKAAALAFLGFDQESGMKPDPYSHLCETCDGYGDVVTGSKVANQDTRQCLDCKGRGYIAEGDAATNGVVSFAGSDTTETGQRVPAATAPESPELEAWRNKGYTIIPPMRTEG